jgi:hypothetical protein
MPRKTHDPIAERFADWAVRIWRGDRTVVDDIRRILPDRGIEEIREGFVGRGANGMVVGIQYGLEPLIALVQLGFLYAGPAWPSLSFFKEAWKLTEKMWREEIRKAERETVVGSPNIPGADSSDRCRTS